PDDTFRQAAERLDHRFRDVSRADAVVGIDRSLDIGELRPHPQCKDQQQECDEDRRRDVNREPQPLQPVESVLHQSFRARIASHTPATGMQLTPTTNPSGSGRSSSDAENTSQPSPRKAASLTNRIPIAKRLLWRRTTTVKPAA